MSNTIYGAVTSLIRKFREDASDGRVYSPKELEIMFTEKLRELQEIKEKNIVIERIGLVRDGHSYDIYKGFDNNYRCWLYESESPITIEKEWINFLFGIILNLDVGQHYGARYFINKVIEHYELDINADEFTGGYNRAKFYFPYYIAPLKIIEKETKMIHVTIGRGGGLIRIK
jgi:hypothetical protein